ncbi:MAG: hypothetical protein MZV64_65000 [Ignavibacteriales bacterium]|nr:hypothetical protein [Ignavibacteriales bacterium]
MAKLVDQKINQYYFNSNVLSVFTLEFNVKSDAFAFQKGDYTGHIANIIQSNIKPHQDFFSIDNKGRFIVFFIERVHESCCSGNKQYSQPNKRGPWRKY